MSNGFQFSNNNRFSIGNNKIAQTTPQIIQGSSLIQRATAAIRGAIGDKISPVGSFLTKQYQGFQKEQKGFSTASILRANIPSEEKERLIKQQEEPMTGERFLQAQLDVALPEIKALGVAAPLIAKGVKQILPSVEKSAKQVFSGFTDLSTKVLNKLVGRTEASKQFILDTMKYTAKKQGLSKAESNLLLETLKEFPSQGKIAIKEFADNVKTKLLPLKANTLTADTEIFPSYGYVSLPKELRGGVNYFERIWESPIQTSAASTHFGQKDFPNYFAHTRIEDLVKPVTGRISPRTGKFEAVPMSLEEAKGIPSGTRRIIETQSDLFQKGGLGEEARVIGKPYEKITLQRQEELTKLQPYRNTWFERIIREEVREAAKDGKKALQFPRGETAMKIEGLGETNVWTTVIDKHLKDLIGHPELLKVGKEITRGAGYHDKWIIIDIIGDGKFKAISRSLLDNAFSEFRKDIQSFIKTGKQSSKLKQYMPQFTETFDISGKIDTQNYVYKLNEKIIPKFLKKIYPDMTKITDPQGVKWWEIKIKPEYKKLPVEAFSIMPLIMLGEREE